MQDDDLLATNDPQLAALKNELVLLDLRPDARERLNLPLEGDIPVLGTGLADDLKNGQIPAAAIAAGIEVYKRLEPTSGEYDRFLAIYYNALAHRALEQQDSYEAQRNFQKALDLDQGNMSAEAAYYLGILIAPDDLTKSIEYLRRSLVLNPAAPAANFELGRFLREQRDLEGAVAAFETAYALDRTSANALSELGETYLMVNDTTKARLAYERAVEIEPDHFVLAVKLGMLRYQDGDLAGAITILRRGLDNAPYELTGGETEAVYIEGLYYLGLAYRDSGKPAQARKLFEAVLDIAPEYQPALTALDELG